MKKQSDRKIKRNTLTAAAQCDCFENMQAEDEIFNCNKVSFDVIHITTCECKKNLHSKKFFHHLNPMLE